MLKVSFAVCPTMFYRQASFLLKTPLSLKNFVFPVRWQCERHEVAAFRYSGKVFIGRYSYLSFKTASSTCGTEPYLWTQPATFLFKVLHVYSMGLYSGEYGEKKSRSASIFPQGSIKPLFMK